MYKFLIVIEKSETGYSAYSPDLPGCVATGRTEREAEERMYGAIEMHVKGMLEDDVPVPKSTATSAYAIVSKPSKQPA
ncbi:MAG: type II toxin-antitoxin system HicB family antitoxin [Methanobacteriota archaeon]